MKIVCSKSSWLQSAKCPTDRVTYTVIADSGEIFHFFAPDADVQLCHFSRYIGNPEEALRTELGRPGASMVPEDVIEGD